MRVIEFDNSFSPFELATALVEAGFPKRSSLSDILAGKVEDADDEVTLGCALDEDEALDELGDDAILRAAAGLGQGLGEHEIEDGIRYARSGQLSLAAAMFERIFQGDDLRAAERALS